MTANCAEQGMVSANRNVANILSRLVSKVLVTTDRSQTRVFVTFLHYISDYKYLR